MKTNILRGALLALALSPFMTSGAMAQNLNNYRTFEEQRNFCAQSPIFQQCMKNFQIMNQQQQQAQQQNDRERWERRREREQERDRYERGNNGYDNRGGYGNNNGYGNNGGYDNRGYNGGYAQPQPQRKLSDNQEKVLYNCQFLPPANQPACRAAVLNAR